MFSSKYIISFKCLLFGVFIITMTNKSSAQANTTSQQNKQFNVVNNLALQGYDPVAYFEQNTAFKGDKKFTVSHHGIIYYFTTIEHKNKFLKSPSSYEPQFGGWCAYAMGNSGDKVEVDPETFKIVNGKLFLFYHTLINNTLKSWNKNESNLSAKAYINWSKIISKN